jgi:hypothetical protein
MRSSLPVFILSSLLGVAATACDDSRGHSDPSDLGFSQHDGPDPDDHDGDGVTPAQGDCDDGNGAVGPNSIELAGNNIDDNCNGQTDEAIVPCDGSALGNKDAMSLAAALGLCDLRFLISAEMKGPSDTRARDVVGKFGGFQKMEGSAMVLLSTGIAADANGAGYVRPQIGTTLDQANTVPNPDLTLPGVAGCGSSQPATVNDYTELAVKLRVPMNVRSLTFQLQFFTTEYPEFVCTAWNDELLVELESQKSGGAISNISFDSAKNPITVNNGFFTICTNDTAKPQTQHCTQSVDLLAGTGYDEILMSKPIGGSTGWLRTSAPVIPGDEITLHFMIFDEGDHIYDSAALLDNFAWSVDVIDAPVTVQ